MIRLTFSALLLASVAAGSAEAGTNLIQNGSFEANGGSFNMWTLSTGSDGSGPGNGPETFVTDGVTAGSYGDVVGADPFKYSPDASGTHAAYFVDDDATETLSQKVTLTAGVTYEIGFDFLETLSGAANSGGFSLAASLGGTTLISFNQSDPYTPGDWYHIFETYTPTTTGSYTFVFTFNSANAVSKDVLVDDVYIQSPPVSPGTPNSPSLFIPEPASAALLVPALLGMIGLRRKRG